MGLRASPSVPGVLTALLAAQRDRWLLWLPVGAIAGAAAWLAAPRDPPFWIAPMLFVAAAGLACLVALWPSQSPHGPFAWLRAVLAGVLALTAAAALGAAAGDLRARLTAQSPFAATDGAVIVEGWVTGVDAGERGPRLRLIPASIEGVAAPPRFVRIAVPGAGALTPGRAARCRAVLAPPAGPIAPGGYDFARRAYFERLGASGYAFGRCRPIALPPPSSAWDRAQLTLGALRSDLSQTIQSASPGRGGAIAAALVTGDRSAIDRDTNETLQNSGLGHLLSVSGVHMAVVGGLVFAAFMWLFALIPPLALRVPVKKLAAAGALIALALYLVISGSSVPALRAFVMAGVAFGAILLDRPGISMRGLALAALIVVLIFPESVLEPGFQMSFAATMALVALFEVSRRTPEENALPTPGILIGGLQHIAQAIGGVIMVSLVAGLATDPFALYHFQRFATYALPANLVAAPIMSFLVAPAAGFAAVLGPFGLADPALEVMSAALDLIAAIGEVFGTRPEAVRALPRPPDLAFALAVLALLWACLWRGRLRWGGAIFLAAGIAWYALAPVPTLAFDAELRAVFARAQEGGESRWTLMRGGGRSTYALERVGAMVGLSPARIEGLPAPQACGESACVWTSAGGRTMALVREETGFARACAPNAIVIASIAAPADFASRCRAALVIDAPDIAAAGGGFLYETDQGLAVARAIDPRVQRRWTPRGATSED